MLHGQTRYNLKSRFLDELPDASLKWLTPRNQGFGSGFAREYQEAWNRGSGLKGIVGAGRQDAMPPSRPLGSMTGTSSIGAAKAAAGHGLRSGQSVFHTKFGEGVILTIEGAGDDARAQVNFGRHGVKWLALAVAKLTPV
jgi:DNA helicase-2/ATP-dependent DNA helicase PcrA